MSIIFNGKRFVERKYANEKEFEDEVISNAKAFFGKSTVFINAKKKIESKSIGGAVPDAFFFDFGDLADPQFYIVEIELSEHNFYNHIFPQITKFFAFFKNTKLQKTLVDKLFSVLNTDDTLKNEFKKYLGQQEIYKFLSDIIESSQNILLIADAMIKELPEITDTYTDTWGKLVRLLEIKRYASGNECVYSVNPDFEAIQYVEAPHDAQDEDDVTDEESAYTEDDHLEGTNDSVREIYSRIKHMAAEISSDLVFNPQKYYISIKLSKNIAFLKIRKKKIRLIAMIPEDEVRKIISSYPVKSLSQSVQDFYNGPSAAIDIDDLEHRSEIQLLLDRLVAHYSSAQS